MIFETDRLILRHWRAADRVPFAAMNADPRVMEFMGGILDRAGSDAFAGRIAGHFDTHGYGLYALELKSQPGSFIGFTGLHHTPFDAPFTPAVEIGWRLAHEHWNHGHATEAARCVLAHAFDDFALPKIVSFTYAGNLPSRRVMEKLGMTHDPADDFDHPRLPADHPHRRMMLYRKNRA